MITLNALELMRKFLTQPFCPDIFHEIAIGKHCPDAINLVKLKDRKKIHLKTFNAYCIEWRTRVDGFGKLDKVQEVIKQYRWMTATDRPRIKMTEREFIRLLTFVVRENMDVTNVLAENVYMTKKLMYIAMDWVSLADFWSMCNNVVLNKLVDDQMIEHAVQKSQTTKLYTFSKHLTEQQMDKIVAENGWYIMNQCRAKFPIKYWVRAIEDGYSTQGEKFDNALLNTYAQILGNGYNGVLESDKELITFAALCNNDKDKLQQYIRDKLGIA